jgi:hypothetical protein
MMPAFDRRGGDPPVVNRDDLLLMMESYKNQIELNTTLLTRQEVIITKQEEIIAKQEEAVTKLTEILALQGKVLASVGAVPDSIEKLVHQLCEATGETCKGINTALDKSLSAARQAQIREHNGINNRIYLGWVGMGTIVIALIGLIVKLLP